MKTRSVFTLGMVAGVAVGTVLAGFLTGPYASAQLPPLSQPRQPQQQGTRILLDERRQEMVYANTFRFTATNEELIADLGLSMPNPNQTAPNPGGEALFDARMRLVMTYATTKRFQEGLTEVVKQYEDRYGPIKTDPPTPKAAGAGTASITPPAGTSPLRP